MQYHELRNTKINYTLNNDKIASLIEKIKIQRRPENASNRFYILTLNWYTKSLISFFRASQTSTFDGKKFTKWSKL